MYSSEDLEIMCKSNTMKLVSIVEMVNTQHKKLRSIKAKLALALIKHQFVISTV